MRNVMKNRVSNHLFDVVRDAIWAGISPDEFKRMTAECWVNALDDEAKSAREVFKV